MHMAIMAAAEKPPVVAVSGGPSESGMGAVGDHPPAPCCDWNHTGSVWDAAPPVMVQETSPFQGPHDRSREACAPSCCPGCAPGGAVGQAALALAGQARRTLP